PPPRRRRPPPPAPCPTPPFEPQVRRGRVYGRGTADNKGQHLAQLLAMESLLAIQGELPCTVKVLLDGEEEIGSPSLGALRPAHPDRPPPPPFVWGGGKASS